jgi:hypothetical protein
LLPCSKKKGAKKFVPLCEQTKLFAVRKMQTDERHNHQLKKANTDTAEPLNNHNQHNTPTKSKPTEKTNGKTPPKPTSQNTPTTTKNHTKNNTLAALKCLSGGGRKKEKKKVMNGKQHKAFSRLWAIVDNFFGNDLLLRGVPETGVGSATGCNTPAVAPTAALFLFSSMGHPTV